MGKTSGLKLKWKAGGGLLKKKRTIMIIIAAAVNALLLILVGLCLWRCGVFTGTLRSQQAAEAWKGESEERFAQVSCFLPVDGKVDYNTVLGFRSTIEKGLSDAGIESTEDRQLWVDAYSTKSTVTVKGEKGSSETTAIGVGGDFFLFHPYELMSGSYLSPDDLMQDRVVLDYELAWKLFGGHELEGMSVTIGGKPYYVAGVIRRETDKFSEKAFSGEPLIFMSYSELEKDGVEAGISCYELVMADPISDFAKNYVKENFAGGKAVVVQNTTRYSFGNIFDIFKNFGSRSISENGVIYPYWENAARISEVYVARQYVFIALLGIIPFGFLVWLIVKFMIILIRKLKMGWANAKEAWSDRYARIEKIKEKRARRKEGKKEPKEKRLHRARKRKSRPEVERGIESPPAQDPVVDEKSIAMDVESILREMMDENGANKK